MLSEKPWRAEAVMQLCVAQIVCLCLGMITVGLLHMLGVTGFKEEESFGNIFIGTLSFQGATLVLIPFFLRRHQVSWCETFGFLGPKIRHPLLLALGFVFVLAVVLLLQAASLSTLDRLGFPPEDQTAVKLLTDAKSMWTTVYLGVFAVVLAPVAEEFIFRGMLFPFVKQLGFPKTAWFGISFLFALIHMNAPTFVPLFVFALALTWLYDRTDNLLAPITAHALFNAVNYTVLLWQNRPANA
jgi:membrane protease YdiL (CAAX protease family)